MQEFVKLLNILNGENLREEITGEQKCKSEHWMSTDFDENVSEFCRLTKEEHIVKLKHDDALEWDTDPKNTKPDPLSSFILRNSKRIFNLFIRETDGFETNIVYYTDTDSLFIEKKTLVCLRKTYTG